MKTQDAILLYMLGTKLDHTISQLAMSMNLPWRDAAKALTILANRGMVVEVGEHEDDGLHVPLYGLTSAGELTARGLRAAQQMMEASDDDEA